MSPTGFWKVAAIALAVGVGMAAGAEIPTMPSGQGLTVVSQQALDTRLFTVQVTTPALPGATSVRILLPAGYAKNGTQRYPVLYLLHGTSGSNADWTTSGNAEAITAGLDLIVVMPDIGLKKSGGGWCTNWPDGSNQWETYHIAQLVPWIDANLRTMAQRSERAIAGLSQGGFCSTSYGARHPDLFGTVLSFSGALDIGLGADAIALSTAVINTTETVLDGVPANSIFGDRVKQEINWAAHDPATLASNLSATNLSEYFGNGQPGPLDSLLFLLSPAGIAAETVESGASVLNVDFHKRLTALGIANTYVAYGGGTHSWPYWKRDLQQSIGPLMTIFNSSQLAGPPSSITYMSGDTNYAVYGWDVTMNRLAREFSTLGNASCAGFALSGSGTGTVVTPPCYTPGKSYKVTFTGKTINSTTVVSAMWDGQLTLTVPLGPANLFQQFTAEADLVGTCVYTTAVSVSPL